MKLFIVELKKIQLRMYKERESVCVCQEGRRRRLERMRSDEV